LVTLIILSTVIYNLNGKDKGDILTVPREVRTPWLMRGVYGFLANICVANAFQYISLAKTTIMIYMNPIFIGLLANAFLGERITNYDVAAIFVTFTGVVVFISNSLTDDNESFERETLGSVLAIFSAFFIATSMLSIRKTGGKVHILMPGISWALVNTLLSGVLFF
jgi:drug/metabolite transporter (DMT)-like permease